MSNLKYNFMKHSKTLEELFVTDQDVDDGIYTKREANKINHALNLALEAMELVDEVTIDLNSSMIETARKRLKKYHRGG